MKHLLIGILVVGLFLASCSGKRDYDIKSNDPYDKGRVSVEDIEKKNPGRFLSVSGTNKRNLLGQTVVRGSITNTAKIVHYKDVEIKLSFYSKTGTLLEEDHETVYESVTPGGSTTFKSKYFAPKGTDSVGLRVITAKF